MSRTTSGGAPRSAATTATRIAPPPTTPSGPSPLDPSSVRLLSVDFVLYLISLSAATLATQIQAAAVGYQLYQITHDPLSLGALGLAEALPFITLAPLGGHVADVV